MPEVIAAQKQLEELEKTYTTEIENTYKEFQPKHNPILPMQPTKRT